LSAAVAYVNAGELQTASTLLRSRGSFDDLCGLLESRTWQELQALDASEIRALLGSIPNDVLDAHPRLLIAAARVAESAARTEWRADLVARAARAASAVGGAADAALKREVDAEVATDLSYEGDVEGTERMCRELMTQASAAEVRTRARALMALGRAQ